MSLQSWRRYKEHRQSIGSQNPEINCHPPPFTAPEGPKSVALDGTPNLRPVCGCSSSLNGELSEWVAQILDNLCSLKQHLMLYPVKKCSHVYVDDLVQEIRETVEDLSEIFVEYFNAVTLYPSL